MRWDSWLRWLSRSVARSLPTSPGASREPRRSRRSTSPSETPERRFRVRSTCRTSRVRSRPSSRCIPRRSARQTPRSIVICGKGSPRSASRCCSSTAAAAADRPATRARRPMRRSPTTGSPEHTPSPGSPSIDASRIGYWGLSQGGWLAASAAQRDPKAAFAISVSAPLVTPRRRCSSRCRTNCNCSAIPPTTSMRCSRRAVRSTATPRER